MENEIKIVIGSWGSYNECNARALGSSWLTLNDYSDADKLRAELVRQGFRLSGIDSELFIQDIEGIPTSGINWDYVNPFDLFETLQDCGALDDDESYIKLCIALEEYPSIKEAAENIDGIEIYTGMTLEEYAEEIIDDCYNIPENIRHYIDIAAFARDLSFDGYRETEINGVNYVYYF